MKQRLISSVVFVVGMLTGVFGGAIAFYLLFALITGACLWELMGLLFAHHQRHKLLRRITGVVLGALPFLLFGSKIFGLYAHIPSGVQFAPYLFAAEFSDNIGPILLALMIVPLLVFALFIVEIFLQSEQPFANIGNYLLGVVYIGIPFSLLITLAYWHGNYAPLRVFGLLLLTWTNDTMAYVVGSRIGKTPLLARISPRKTWEGTLGGAAFTFLAALLMSMVIHDFEPAEWFTLAFCTAVFGTLGDLVESMLKRSIQIKDSGSFLPGHGGFLDRFDAFIFVLPFVWLALMILEG